MNSMQKNNRGFTLIELLIVIAIIAILALIAIPNFLEAQTRSKVSRVRADMRTMATALEAYFVDWNQYPYGADAEDFRAPAMPPTQAFECFLPIVITTPIAYTTRLLPDMFFNQGVGHGKNTPFHYNEAETAKRLGADGFVSELTLVLTGSLSTAVRWFMFSHGPDGDHDESLDGSVANLATRLYDPTNGTISNGDIYLFGPGYSFR
ncbi:MAG: prepilin-type N-terminal cleavage/methylation domain-containing protein [Candidatus Sumerlaeota bacterium]|nr:prepilin-type N-terminal cleavage/methylation domain-containing protein [Candidatus Sumerlaeota bacterium]